MKTNIVRIGNSKGIRLPKSVLEQCHFKDTVELEVENNTLIIRSVQTPRNGWSEAFSKMAQRQDDKLFDENTSQATEWDRSQWR